MPKTKLEETGSVVATKPAKKQATAKTAKPKLTAAERAAARKALQEKAEADRKAAWDAFNAERPMRWLELWAKALRLHILLEAYPDVRYSNSWWFEDFKVDALAQTFSCEEVGGHPQSEAKLHPSDVQRLHESLDRGHEYVTEFLAERERKRLEELERQQKIAAAKAKLTAEDMQVLGIR